MGSTEVAEPTFVSALRAVCPRISRYSDREIASWIVARLNYLISGALEYLGTDFSHDTNQLGFKVKLTDKEGNTIAHGAVVIEEKRS
jgi:hypothetical protein